MHESISRITKSINESQHPQHWDFEMDFVVDDADIMNDGITYEIEYTILVDINPGDRTERHWHTPGVGPEVNTFQLHEVKRITREADGVDMQIAPQAVERAANYLYNVAGSSVERAAANYYERMQ